MINNTRNSFDNAIYTATTFNESYRSKCFTWKIIFTILLIVILLLGIVGNSLVIMAARNSIQLQRRITTIFIVSLAFSDLTIGISQIPLKIYFELNSNVWYKSVCYYYFMSDAIGYVANILSLFAIVIDRFILLQIPFWYNNLLSSLKAKLLVISIWIFSFGWGILCIFSWTRLTISTIFVENKSCVNDNYVFYATSFFGIYGPVLFIMTISYTSFMILIHRHIKAIKLTEIKNNVVKLNREIKATKTVAVIYLSFLISYFPSCVINGMIFVDPKYFPNLKSKKKLLIQLIFYIFIEILPVISTAANPLIYSFMDKNFRNEFNRIIYRMSLKVGVKIKQPELKLRRRGIKKNINS
ncbi:adenosine receptor A2b isoform X1 [Hydra vulgaris]|uniref:adenosine receptor A2b isoform X1 n=1 Tax=Hydra vulgaris TaxID=6087 RepID=UPI00019262F9|nr:adenosine receptor A2b [Hydra vulgaris]